MCNSATRTTPSIDCYVPFPKFEARWTAAQQQEYRDLLQQADLVRCISKAYYCGAYQRRNEWMVDHASRVIAVFNGEPGGMRNTIEYAKKIWFCFIKSHPRASCS